MSAARRDAQEILEDLAEAIGAAAELVALGKDRWDSDAQGRRDAYLADHPEEADFAKALRGMWRRGATISQLPLTGAKGTVRLGTSMSASE